MSDYDSIIEKIYSTDKEEAEIILINLMRLAKADGVFDEAEKNTIIQLMRKQSFSHHCFYRLLDQIDDNQPMHRIKHSDQMLLYMIMLAYIDGQLSQQEWSQIKVAAEAVMTGHDRLNELHLFVKQKIYSIFLNQINTIQIKKDIKEKFLNDIREYLGLPLELAELEETKIRPKHEVI